jgi:hypothetical protein
LQKSSKLRVASEEMIMAYKNERYWLRFFHLSQEHGDKLRAVYFYEGIRAVPNKDFPGKFVISLPLNEALALAPIREFITDAKLGEDAYGVFVSLVTDRETAIVSVPKFVRDLIRDVGGQVDFSFTIIHSDEVDRPDESGVKQ